MADKIVDYRALGRRIQERRQQLGLSQIDAAEKLDISVSFFSRVERGEKVASLETIIKIARFFGFLSNRNRIVIREYFEPLNTLKPLPQQGF